MRSDGALTDSGAWLAAHFLVIIDLGIDEENPVVQVLVAGWNGREGRHGLLRRPAEGREPISLASTLGKRPVKISGRRSLLPLYSECNPL